MVNALKSEFGQLEEAQNIINKQYEGGVKTEGIVSGRERYAPNIQEGIVFGAMAAGLAEIAKIRTAKEKAILEAQQAGQNQQYKILDAKMNVARQLAQDEQNLIQKTYENVQTAKTKQIENEKTSAEMFAPILAAKLTGNEKVDMETANQLAVESGNKVSPLALYSYAKAWKDEQAQKNVSLMTSTMKEYRDYKSAGGKLDYLGFTAAQKGSSGTVEERKMSAIQEYSQVFIPGATIKNPNGKGEIPVLNDNGYIDPTAWKMAITDAISNKLTRKDFIQQFGHLLEVDDNGNVKPEYGLTKQENKLVTGILE